MNLHEQRIYRFGNVELYPWQHSLNRDGQQQHLRPQAFQVLLYLIEQRSRLVTKEELIENIWKVAAVTDDALVQVVGDIRKAVGDDPRHPIWIKTIPKSGYRFIGSVEEILPDGSLSTEIEEVTTLEVEVQEEFSETPVEKEIASIPSPSPIFSSQRIVLLIAGILTIAVVSLYFAEKLLRNGSEVSVLRVPGKKSVAVMFFDKQSATDDLNWLCEGLPDMLITGLSRSGQLTLLSRQQLHLLLERIGHKEPRKIRLDEALQVAKKSGAEVIVLGSFTGIGEQIRIDVQLHDAPRGQLIAAEHLVVEKPQQILTQVDFLSFKLASDLGVSPQNTSTSLASAMTNNLEAYRYYSLALGKANALHNTEAIELLEKAIELDPQFAMAHARIGYAYSVTWNFPERAKPHLEKAFQLANRLTEKDRLYIAAWYAIANLDYPAAVESFREIIAKNPSDVEAYLRLGILLDGEGQGTEAVEVLRQGLAFDPEAKEIMNVLGGLYGARGRHNDAIAMHQWYVDLAPDEANAHDSLGISYQWAGRYGNAIQAYNRALELDPNFEVAVVHLGNTYFQMGRYQDAIHEFERYIKMAPSDLERSRGYDTIAYVFLKRGKLDQAEAAAQMVLRYNADAVLHSVIFALERGDRLRSAALHDQFLTNSSTGRGRRRDMRILNYVKGVHAFKNGQTSEAVETFKEALRSRPPAWNIDSFEDCLANAYLSLGRFDEAIAEYERILQLNPNYPLAHYHLAQAYERKGMQHRARESYEHFLQIWSEADTDLSEVRIAQQKINAHALRSVKEEQ